MSVAEEYVTQSAEIPSLKKYEDCDIVLFEAPFDGLIANAVFTPSEYIQGAYYTRSLQLHVRSQDDGNHVVTDLSLDSDDVLLPGYRSQNLSMIFPPVSVRVRKNDSIVWSSIGSVGEGLIVPSSEVKILFEKRDVEENVSLPVLWRSCVPSYWIGKDIQVTYHDRDIVSPRGNFSSTFLAITGNLLDADTSGIRLRVQPEDGESMKERLLFYNRIGELGLIPCI